MEASGASGFFLSRLFGLIKGRTCRAPSPGINRKADLVGGFPDNLNADHRCCRRSLFGIGAVGGGVATNGKERRDRPSTKGLHRGPAHRGRRLQDDPPFVCVDHNLPLASVPFFAALKPRGSPLGCSDGRTVKMGGAGRRLSPGPRPIGQDEQVVYGLEQAGVTPAAELEHVRFNPGRIRWPGSSWRIRLG